MTEISQKRLSKFIDDLWAAEIVGALTSYIAIPNKSPAFEPDWQKLGHMERAVELLTGWAREKLARLPGATLDVLRLPGRTPLIVIDAPGAGPETVLLYGHLDKQPEMTGWAPGKGPWTPVLEGERLFGRGGADDGYSIFAAVTALLALGDQGAPRARCVIIIEASEESGSPDLPHYMEILKARLGEPSLVICLDSGCGDYERLWLTTSLRGLAGGVLRVDVLTEGVHSGDASGIVPSSMRILRRLLDRIEDVGTGRVLIEAAHAEIPPERLQQARAAAAALGVAVYDKFPFVDGMRPAAEDLAELVLARTWRPALSITGFDGAPTTGKAGNVLRPYTAARLSLRLPPTIDAERASSDLKKALEADPPYQAKVSFTPDQAGSGWNAPPVAPWLDAALAAASEAAWGQPHAMLGEGGSIPFMGMLGEVFPKAQFVVTGVLGPNSNAHGPNEFLDLPTARRVTACVANTLAAHHAQAAGGEKKAKPRWKLF